MQPSTAEKKVAKTILGSKHSSDVAHLHTDKNTQCGFVCHSISKSLTQEWILMESGFEKAASILKWKY